MIKLRFLNSPRDIQEAALNTAGRESGKEFTPELFAKYLKSEHSPIRSLTLRVEFIGMSYYTSVHFARHVHALHFVKSNRPDRTGKPRSVGDTVNHMMDVNCQALIDMARKRLCVGKCAPDTYQWMAELKKTLIESADPYMTVLGHALMPNCEYRGACPEFRPCGYCAISRI